MLGQKLQKADELPCPKLRPQPLLQALAHLGKQRRQLPITEHVGMVQRRRPAAQTGQIMQRLQYLLVLPIRAHMPGHHLGAGHDLDVVYVTLDRDRAKSVGPRHAVAVGVELHGLVLIDFGWPHNTGIKGLRRQR